MGKGFIFISLALFIDGLQAFLDWAFVAAGGALQALTPVGGGVAGAAAGALACWNSSGSVISGIVDAAKCAAAGVAVGAAASSIGIPLGIGIGFAVNFVISATLGVMLITGLVMFGFIGPGDWKFAVGAGFAETIPGLDALPGWTLFTVRCVIKSVAKKGKLAGTAAQAFGKVLGQGSPVGAAAGAIFAVNSASQSIAREGGVFTKEQQDERLQERKNFISKDLANIKNFDGVRAAQNPRTT